MLPKNSAEAKSETRNEGMIGETADEKPAHFDQAFSVTGDDSSDEVSRVMTLSDLGISRNIAAAGVKLLAKHGGGRHKITDHDLDNSSSRPMSLRDLGINPNIAAAGVKLLARQGRPKKITAGDVSDKTSRGVMFLSDLGINPNIAAAGVKLLARNGGRRVSVTHGDTGRSRHRPHIAAANVPRCDT